MIDMAMMYQPLIAEYGAFSYIHVLWDAVIIWEAVVGTEKAVIHFPTRTWLSKVLNLPDLAQTYSTSLDDSSFLDGCVCDSIVSMTMILLTKCKRTHHDSALHAYLSLYRFLIQLSGVDISPYPVFLCLENTEDHPVLLGPSRRCSACISIYWWVLMSWLSKCNDTMAFAAGGFLTGVKIAILKLFALKPELHWPALLWLVTSTVADLLITGTLVRSLVCLLHLMAVYRFDIGA